jgi:hypothetical protein
MCKCATREATSRWSAIRVEALNHPDQSRRGIDRPVIRCLSTLCPAYGISRHTDHPQVVSRPLRSRRASRQASKQASKRAKEEGTSCDGATAHMASKRASYVTNRHGWSGRLTQGDGKQAYLLWSVISGHTTTMKMNHASSCIILVLLN